MERGVMRKVLVLPVIYFVNLKTRLFLRVSVSSKQNPKIEPMNLALFLQVLTYAVLGQHFSGKDESQKKKKQPV